MRPIDADELLKRVDQSWQNAGLHGVDYHKFKKWVHSMPTIEAEPKHGRWETLENGHDAVCSNCHKYWIPTEDKYDYWFCPRCGAKMDEVKE